MKFTLFQKDADSATGGHTSEVQTIEGLLERMEAASRAADIAVKKAEATARKAEAAATKAEVLVKQVQLMLDQVGQTVATNKPAQEAVLPTKAFAKDIRYAEEVEIPEKIDPESGIPLVAPFIVDRGGMEE